MLGSNWQENAKTLPAIKVRNSIHCAIGLARCFGLKWCCNSEGLWVNLNSVVHSTHQLNSDHCALVEIRSTDEFDLACNLAPQLLDHYHHVHVQLEVRSILFLFLRSFGGLVGLVTEQMQKREVRRASSDRTPVRHNNKIIREVT